jgi:putative sporulation protein YyaC
MYCNVLCLGDINVPGDAVGPIVGTELLRRGVLKANIVGDMRNPVVKSNYNERIKELFNHIPTIVVDSHIAKMGPLFYYTFIKGSTKPGAILHDDFAPIGDFAMRCWVARTPQELLTVDEAVVIRLARDMTTGLLDLINRQQLKEYI